MISKDIRQRPLNSTCKRKTKDMRCIELISWVEQLLLELVA
jgi:hypothetical protein